MFYEPRTRGGHPIPPVKERLAAFRSVPRFIRMVWATKPSYGVGIVVAQVLSGLTPIAMLWVGKLIIDTVIANLQSIPSASLP